jgi:hypothetical protein
VLLALALSVLPAVAVARAGAGPSEAGEPVESPARAALLGQSEAELRERHGAALRSRKIEARRALGTGLSPALPGPPDSGSGSGSGSSSREGSVTDPFAGQRRLVRSLADADLRQVEYDLFGDRVYRVRWQLATRFERPIMAALVERLSAELGKPYYDQLIEGKFGSGRATLRRAAWRNGQHTLEVRQLTPLLGGPLFVTLSDRVALQAISAAGGTASPEPDSIGPWWQEPLPMADLLNAGERDALLAAFDRVLAQTGWQDGSP